jgi:hypothetical protein
VGEVLVEVRKITKLEDGSSLVVFYLFWKQGKASSKHQLLLPSDAGERFALRFKDASSRRKFSETTPGFRSTEDGRSYWAEKTLYKA